MSHRKAEHPAVHRITEARESHTVERDTRVRKYTISMLTRVVCFVLAFFVDGWLRWTLLAAAIVLPYIAVVIANGGADVTKRQPPAEFYHDRDAPQLDAAPAAPEPGDEAAEDTVIEGSFVEEPQDGTDTSTPPHERHTQEH